MVLYLKEKKNRSTTKRKRPGSRYWYNRYSANKYNKGLKQSKEVEKSRKEYKGKDNILM